MEQTEAFRILASADRQLVLHELVEGNGALGIDELSRHVAARRHRTELEKIGDDEVESAHIRLVHTHLPHLAERDVIDVDWDRGAVDLADGEDVAQLFDAAGELEEWPPNDRLDHPSRRRNRTARSESD